MDVKGITTARATMARALTAVELIKELSNSKSNYYPGRLLDSNLNSAELEVPEQAQLVLLKAVSDMAEDPSVQEFDGEFEVDEADRPMWKLAKADSGDLMKQIAKSAQEYRWPEGMREYDPIVRP